MLEDTLSKQAASFVTWSWGTPSVAPGAEPRCLSVPHRLPQPASTQRGPPPLLSRAVGLRQPPRGSPCQPRAGVAHARVGVGVGCGPGSICPPHLGREVCWKLPGGPDATSSSRKDTGAFLESACALCPQ